MFSGWGVSDSHAPPSGPLSVRPRSPVRRDCCSMGSVMVPPWGAQESGLLVVAGPATGQLNTRFAWRPGQRMFGAVGDPWSKQPVAPSAQSGVDQGADSGAAVGSLVWRPVGKTKLVRSLGVILRRWDGPAVAASAGEAAAPGARTFGAVCAPRSS